MSQESVAAIFNELDANHDGVISAEELKGGIASGVLKETVEHKTRLVQPPVLDNPLPDRELTYFNDPTDPDRPITLNEVLRQAVAKYPEKVGFMYLDRDLKAKELTYSQFYSQVRKCMTGLKAQGVVPGDKVCLQLSEYDDSVLMCWAIWQLGASILPLPVPDAYNVGSTKLQKLEAAMMVCDQSKILVVTNSSKKNAILALRANTIPEHKFPEQFKVCAVEDLLDNEEAEDNYTADKDYVAAYMLTSGSTGNPKAVQLSHHSLVESIYGTMLANNFDDQIRVLNWIAVDHVASVCDGNLLPLVCGGTQCHIKAMHVVEDPTRLLKAIHQYRFTSTFAPNFIFQLIVDRLNDKKTNTSSWDLSCLECIMSGGEAVVVESAVRLIRTLKEKCGMHDHVLKPGFGMTEICAGSVWNHEFPTEDDCHNKFASLGCAKPGLEMRVVDDEGKLCGDGIVGNLQFKGVICFRGYYMNETATNECYPNGLDDWFNTGDLGVLTGGNLRLAGRTKDIMIINGQNFESADCENKINGVEGVETSFTAAFPIRLDGMQTEEFAIVYHSTRSLEDDSYLFKTYMKIRDMCVGYIGIRPYAIICLPQSGIPKTTLGKIERRKLRARFENGEYAAEEQLVKDLIQRAAGVFKAPETDHEQKVLNVWVNVLGYEPEEISTTINFFDIGGTSLDTIAVKAQLDEVFGFDIPAVWLFSYPTIVELAATILKKELIRDRLYKADGSLDHEFANNLYDPIVRFHDSGDKKPLFAVHTGAGDVLAFMELAKRFQNDRPFYGVRTRGFDEGETFFDNFYTMIRSYCTGIINKQPEGPYYVMGYSYGAVVAYEIALMLEHEFKVDVAFCASVDTPVELRGFGEIPNLDMHVYLVVYLGLVEKNRYANVLRTLRQLEDEKEWVPELLKHCNEQKLDELKITVDTFNEVIKVAWAFKHMALQQKTQGRVTNMQVFSCFRGEPMMVASPEWRRQQRMWANHAHNIQFYNIRGHHESALNPENVVSFHKVFNSALMVADIQAEERALFVRLGGVPVDQLEEKAEGAEETLFNHDEHTIASMEQELDLEQMEKNMFECKSIV